MNNPPRAIVKPDVVRVIYQTMQGWGRPDKDYSEADLAADETISLVTNLRIADGVRALMYSPYTKISKDKHGGKAVLREEAKAATTVKKAIDLVHAKANDKGKTGGTAAKESVEASVKTTSTTKKAPAKKAPAKKAPAKKAPAKKAPAKKAPAKKASAKKASNKKTPGK